MRLAPADIPVVILCGGMGTRIREASEILPKPMIDIGGRPILWHIMRLYSEHGFRRFVLPLGFKGWTIKEYFLRYRENLADFTVLLGNESGPRYHNRLGLEDWEVTLVETGLHTATSGRIRAVADHLDAETFAVTYGDGLADVDLAAELEFHAAHGGLGTVLGVLPTSRYGELVVHDTTVTAFAEKPDTIDTFVNGGFFLFQRSFLDELPDDDDMMLEQAPLSSLAHRGELFVYRHSGFWMGMDTFREYTALNQMWEAGTAPWRTWSE